MTSANGLSLTPLAIDPPEPGDAFIRFDYKPVHV